LGPEEGEAGVGVRAVEEWPPPSGALDTTNKDGTASRLLFFTVQYVGEDPGTSFNTGLEGFSELEQRMVSPLDPNLGCTGCYSPVYRPTSPAPLITGPVSPSSNYLTNESNMIVLGEQCQLDNYVVGGARLPGFPPCEPDSQKQLLLLPTDTAEPTELVLANEPSGDQRVELVLSNGTIAYGIMESPDDTGTRVIQIPREYLVTARSEDSEEQEQSFATVKNGEKISGDVAGVQEDSVQDENSHLRALYNTLKEQGLIIESGELRLETEPALETVPAPTVLQSVPPLAPPLAKRYWCEECNLLLTNDCREHQVNRKISDKAVPSRARATLPANYLAINKISGTQEEEYGVFARKSIPKRTQFGPIEGVVIKTDEVMVVHEGPHLELSIETEQGELRTLDVSNEHMSNWMRFVRMATPDTPPNLLLSQMGASLYFTTTQTIHPRHELLVWYSQAYAARRNLPRDPPTPVWTCATCGAEAKTCDELTKHALCHKKKEGILNREENLTVNTLRRKNQAFVATVDKNITDRNTNTSNNNCHKLRYECAICQKRFPRRYSLKRHILLLHTQENKYHCKICHLGFSHSYNRLRHMRRVHPNHKEVPKVKNVIHRYESWTCSHCEMTFNSSPMLNLHMLVHAVHNVEDSEDEGFFKTHTGVECPQCPQKFINRQKLAAHVAEHGKNKDCQDKKLHCDICGRNFTNAVRYQNHMDMHGNDKMKPLECHVCFKRVLTQSALSCHLKIHDCHVQWECPVCKQRFGNVLALKTHVHSHAVNGRYPCPQCEKTFDEYSGIRKHIRAFHSDRKYTCADCGKHFPTQDKLRMHLLKHSDHREFLCADCGKQFKRKDKLKEHMKRIHSADKEKGLLHDKPTPEKKVLTKLVVNSSDYERYIYKCHSCMLGFKRRGMLVNHLANRHPDITPDSVPELNLPILKTTRDYYCQYCDKIYKSSSKRKAHILKNHPGLELPMSNRQKGGIPDIPGLPNPTFSQTVGSITTDPHSCQWCHKQYASKAKLLQHQRKKHVHLMPSNHQAPRPLKNLSTEDNIEDNIDIEETGNDDAEMEFPESYVEIAEDEGDPEPIPIALSANLNHHITLSAATLSQMHEYEIITSEDDAAGNNILIDSSALIKRNIFKNDVISSDLLSQAMSEIGVSLSDLRALSDQLYSPYTPR